MRKLIVLMVVALVMVILAAPVGAKKVVNESYSQYEVQAWFGSDDGSSRGSAWAVDGNNGAYIGIDWDATYDCSNNPPSNVASLSIHGDGDLNEAEDPNFEVWPTKGKDKFTRGYAHGVFTGGRFYVEFCNGVVVDELLIDGPFFIRMDGTDRSIFKTSDSSSFHIPGDYNSHRNDRGTFRFAGGLFFVAPYLLAGLTVEDVDGAIGEVSWSEHLNQH